RDPLARALAEGRTPSPEIVANAGAQGSLSASLATTLFLASALGVVAVAMLAGRATIWGLVPLERSPESLAIRARTVLERLGCTDLPADQRYGFYYDFDYLNYAVNADSSAKRWSGLAAGESPAVVFWYRQSPQYLVATGLAPRIYPGRVTPSDPAPN